MGDDVCYKPQSSLDIFVKINVLLLKNLCTLFMLCSFHIHMMYCTMSVKLMATVIPVPLRGPVFFLPRLNVYDAKKHILL